MKNASKKAIVLLLAAVLLIGCVAGGTFAYLFTKSNTVTNTFVTGEIGKLELKEDTGDSYTIIPGVNITKDPEVSFGGNNIPAYVFLKVEADGWNVSDSAPYTYTIGSNNAKMEWVLAEGWTKLEGEKGVYYRQVPAATDATALSWPVIKGDTITVGTGITEQTIDSYAQKLIFTAYAIQQAAFNGNIADAWEKAQG